MKLRILTRLTETFDKKLRRFEESYTGEQFGIENKGAEKEMVEALAKRVNSKRKFNLIAVYNVDEAEEEGEQKKKKGTGVKKHCNQDMFLGCCFFVYFHISHIFIHTFSYL